VLLLSRHSVLCQLSTVFHTFYLRMESSLQEVMNMEGTKQCDLVSNNRASYSGSFGFKYRLGDLAIFTNTCRGLSQARNVLPKHYIKLFHDCFVHVGRDSSVGIATGYGLDGPGIESRCGARFSAPAQTETGAHPAYCTMGTGSFPGVKRPGRGVDHPPPYSADVNLLAPKLFFYNFSRLCI